MTGSNHDCEESKDKIPADENSDFAAKKDKLDSADENVNLDKNETDIETELTPEESANSEDAIDKHEDSEIGENKINSNNTASKKIPEPTESQSDFAPIEVIVDSDFAEILVDSELEVLYTDENSLESFTSNNIENFNDTRSGDMLIVNGQIDTDSIISEKKQVINFESGEYLKSVLEAELRVNALKKEIEEIRQGKHKIFVFTENFAYGCQVCGSEVSRNANSCKNCGVEFSYIMCEDCGFTGQARDFKNHTCPECSAKPSEIPGNFPEIKKCSSCKQLLRDGAFSCHYCSWIDAGAMIWFLAVVILLLSVLPIIGRNIDGFAGEILNLAGLTLGGLFLWNFGQVLLTVFDKPRRFGFYWFISVIAAFSLLV